MYEDAEVMDQPEGLPGAEDDGAAPVKEERSSLWALIALGILGLLLIWIILGVWRYLQVLGYGAP